MWSTLVELGWVGCGWMCKDNWGVETGRKLGVAAIDTGVMQV